MAEVARLVEVLLGGCMSEVPVHYGMVSVFAVVPFRLEMAVAAVRMSMKTCHPHFRAMAL